MVEAFPWMPLLFDMMAGSVTDQLTRPKMDVHRSLEAAGLGLRWKTRRWQPSDQKPDWTAVNTGVKSMVPQRTIKILVSVHLRKMNTNLWTSHREPTLKINVLWAALPNMSCKPRCQFGFLHPSLSACCPGLSLPTDNLSVSLVCVSIDIYLFPHDFFFPQLFHVFCLLSTSTWQA